MKAILKTLVENKKRFLVLYIEPSYGPNNPYRLTCIDTDSGEQTFKYIENVSILETCQFSLELDGKVVWESKVIPV